MSIIPAGNRREQVAQGALKNQSFFDNDLFKKVAVDIGRLIEGDPVKSKQPQPGNELQQTMNSGSLGHDQMADSLEQDRNPPPEATQDQQPGIPPVGGGGELRAVPLQEQGEQQQPVESMRKKLIQIDGFLKQRMFQLKGSPKKVGNEGLYQLSIGPMQGTGIPNSAAIGLAEINHMADQISQIMGIALPENLEATSTADDSGIFNIMIQATPQIDKVMKPGNG